MLRYTQWLSGAALCAALLTSSAQAQHLTTTLVANGFARPLYVTSPPGDSSRLFVVEQWTAKIRIVENGVLLGTDFLDINPLVIGSGNERGLLGMAFHPNYASNGLFYVSYNDNAGSSVIRQYTVSANPNVADSASGVTIFGPLGQPFSNHNGGNIQFGPDGMMYFALGDGGSANDPGNRAQSLAELLGKMLRLDVDNPPTYVAAGNPYIGAPNDPGNTIDDRIWSLGLRNPWRWSFDRLTGDLYIGDVGQDAREEINFAPSTSTGMENYGWRCMEGIACTGLTGCTCNAPSLIKPIRDYTHSAGCSVTGGYVYRGNAIPLLDGTYIYADYCSGRIWSFEYGTGSVVNFTERTAELDPPGALNITGPASFGEDADGEIYIVDHTGGEVFKIVPNCLLPDNYCIATPNSTLFPASMSFSGSTSVAANDLVLEAQLLPPGAIGIFFVGGSATQVPFGNGYQCVGAPVARLGSTVAMGGTATLSFNNGGVYPVGPMDTAFFQHWYRNPAGGGAGFNLTDGLAVTFCP